YGRTKAAGEVAVMNSGADAWVVRTAWVYGVGGSNFVHTIARLEREKETIRVVDDQHGSPTSAKALARGLLQLGERIVTGEGPPQRTLHCTCQGSTTWYVFARAIFEELGADPERVQPCSTEDFPRPAPRPARSALSPKSWLDAGLDPLPEWPDALAANVREHGDAIREESANGRAVGLHGELGAPSPGVRRGVGPARHRRFGRVRVGHCRVHRRDQGVHVSVRHQLGMPAGHFPQRG